MIYQKQAYIINNTRLSPSIFRIELDIPGLSKLLKPGQFIHLKINKDIYPLLRRPFSVFELVKKRNSNAQLVCVLYKVVGEGTRILSEKKPGQKLDVLGPLGNGFDINAGRLANNPIVLVAGGMGIAPLFYLAKKLRQKIKERKIILFIGMQTKKELVAIDEFKRLGVGIEIATDDGSCGYKGYVSELLYDFLKNKRKYLAKPYVYACGPGPMLKRVSELSRKFSLAGQVSIDKMMGCGIGACLGCVVKLKKGLGYKRVCKDGPVFSIDEILWED